MFFSYQTNFCLQECLLSVPNGTGGSGAGAKRTKRRKTKALPGSTLTHTFPPHTDGSFAATMGLQITSASAQGYGRRGSGAGTNVAGAAVPAVGGGGGGFHFTPFHGSAPPTEDPRGTKRNQDNISKLNAAQDDCNKFLGKLGDILDNFNPASVTAAAQAPAAAPAPAPANTKHTKLKELLELQALAKQAGNTVVYNNLQEEVIKAMRGPNDNDDNSDDDSALG